MGARNGVGLIVVGMLTIACDGESPKATAAAAEAPKTAAASAAQTPEREAKPAEAKTDEAEPEGSPAEQKLNEARRIQFQDPAEAYRIAMESYELEPDVKALWVLGPAACRLKDVDKARWVRNRLVDEDRAKFEGICASKGVELKPDPV